MQKSPQYYMQMYLQYFMHLNWVILFFLGGYIAQIFLLPAIALQFSAWLVYGPRKSSILCYIFLNKLVGLFLMNVQSLNRNAELRNA